MSHRDVSFLRVAAQHSDLQSIQVIPAEHSEEVPLGCNLVPSKQDKPLQLTYEIAPEQRCSMSSGSGVKIRIPSGLVFNHRVQNDEQFSHHRH